MSARERIAMTPDEVQAFLAEERTLTCATVGRDGWPHLMPLWYVVRDGECWAWTYAKSQKVRNLEREARCTIQVEAGLQYRELRGVMMRCAAAIHRDVETVAGVGAELAERYGGSAADMRKQAPKRVALQFITSSVASWDHRKL
jgi:general stress protein 26